MRRKIIAGNWKMNNNLNSSISLINSISQKIQSKTCEVYVAPSFPFFTEIQNKCQLDDVKILAQNVSHFREGAFTGEVSCDMLKSVGVNSVIIGHSERRNQFKEDNNILLDKIKICLKNNFEVFFCIGEDLKSRESNLEHSIIEEQLKNTIFQLPDVNLRKLIIAYEPIWAIGTGMTANPEQIQEMHKFIRDLFKNKYSDSKSSILPIIYGGSVNSKNSKKIFQQNDVDGGLIGGASLISNDFVKIINSI